MKNWKIILAILTANVTLMSAGYTMLIPFLPMYLINELGVSLADVKLWNGAIFSVTFLLGGILAPLWGKMADTHGKKMMAIRASFGLAVSYYLGGIVTTPEEMFGVRVLQGFAAGLWSVCLAIATSFIPPEKLGVSLGFLQSGLTCGCVIGPLLGGTLATVFGMRSSFFVAGTLLLLITLIFYFYIPEPSKAPVKEKEVPQVHLLKRPIIREILVYVGLGNMLILMIQPILSLYVSDLSHGEGNIVFLAGFVFSLVGIAGAITAPVWGRFGQSHGFYLSFILSALLGGILDFIVALPDDLTWFCVTNFIYGLCCAGIQPSLSAILANNTESNQRGRVFGYMFSAQQFGAMVGPLLGGLIATYFPLKTLFFVVGAIWITTSLIAYIRHGKE